MKFFLPINILILISRNKFHAQLCFAGKSLKLLVFIFFKSWTNFILSSVEHEKKNNLGPRWGDIVRNEVNVINVWKIFKSLFDEVVSVLTNVPNPCHTQHLSLRGMDIQLNSYIKTTFESVQRGSNWGGALNNEYRKLRKVLFQTGKQGF